MSIETLTRTELPSPKEAKESKLAVPGSGEVGESLLHRQMNYAPRDILICLDEVLGASKAHRESFAAGRVTDQLRGSVGERLTFNCLQCFGRLERLPVVRQEGQVTADYLLHVERTLVVAPGTVYQPGQKVIVEVKHGDWSYCYRELRCAESHGRRQLRETMEREGADGAICFVPRECQDHPALFADVRQDTRATDGGRIALWMGLPDRRAIESAVALRRNTEFP